MSDYRRYYLEGGNFFFTAVTYLRTPIFISEAAVELLEQSFEYVMRKRPFKIDAMVVLPDHLHCIWTLPKNDFDFSVRWRLLKTSFSRAYIGSAVVTDSMRKKKERGIWQRRFWEHAILSQDDYNRHCNYIHYNPVKHGLVCWPGEWSHSSFNKFVEEGLYQSDWGQEVGKDLLEMNLE